MSATQQILLASGSAGVAPPVGLNDGDPVTTWTDSSTGGHNATQTGTARPTFKTNILNGKPVVRFTSAGLSGLNLASVISGADPFTVFAVIKQATGTDTIGSIVGNAAPGLPLGPFMQTPNSYVANHLGYGQLVTPTNVFHVFYGGSNAVGTQTVFIDGTVVSGSGIASANSGDFAYIGYYGGGTPTYSNGDIAEILIYNTDVGATPTNRANLERYLGTKYGITVAGGTAVDPSTVTGLVGWWKADSLLPSVTPPALVDGDPVSLWPDKSFGGHDASNTGTARPTFKTNIINGKPVVRFTSAGLNVLNLASTIPEPGGSTWTSLAVLKSANASGSNLTTLGAAPATAQFTLVERADTLRYYAAGGTPVGMIGNAHGAAFHVVTSIGNSGNMWVDGTAQGGASAGTAGTTSNYNVIGASSAVGYSDGDIAELIFYSAAVSGTDRANLEKYLGTKYGITVAGGSAVQPDTVAGLQAWWKADSLLPPVAALTDGDPVSLWPDSNFRGHDATQTGTARPIFKTNIINGKPVVRFSTAGTSGLNLANVISSAPNFTVFAVMKATSPTVYGVTLGASTGTVPYALLHNNDDSIFTASSDSYGQTAAGGGWSSAFHVFVGINLSGATGVDVDGVQVASVATPWSQPHNFDTIGWNPTGPIYSDCDIAEIIIYNRWLVDFGTDQINITKYLGTKYGITVAGGTAVDPSTVTGLVGWWKADSLL